MAIFHRRSAHFHYDADTDIDLSCVKISNVSILLDPSRRLSENGSSKILDGVCVELALDSGASRWKVRSGWLGLQELDAAVHCCLFSRRESELRDLQSLVDSSAGADELSKILEVYFQRFQELFGNRFVCSTVLDFLELGPRGNHVRQTDCFDSVDSASGKEDSQRKHSNDSVDSGSNAQPNVKKSHNTVQTLRNEPAVGAAHVIKDYVAQSPDELTLTVGEMISVIEMRRGESRWRGKIWLEKADIRVGYFPPDCVQLLGGAGKQPTEVNVVTPKDVASQKHVGQLLSNLFATRPSKTALRRNGIMKERVFSCDLGEYLSSLPEFASGVPPVFTLCSYVIERYGLIDGVYRLSGSSSAIQTLRTKLDNDEYLLTLLEEHLREREREREDRASVEGEHHFGKKQHVVSNSVSESGDTVDADSALGSPLPRGESVTEVVDGAASSKARKDSDLSVSLPSTVSASSSTAPLAAGDAGRPTWFVDIHSVASVLKTYFRELPNPLFTFELFSQFQELVNFEAKEQLVRAYKLIHQLPPPHYRTASALFRHLHTMAMYESRTNMGARNLAIVWSPNLLRSKRFLSSPATTAADQNAVLREMANQTVIVEFFIRNSTLLFSDKLIILRDTVPIADLPSVERVLLSIDEAQRQLLRRPMDDSADSAIDDRSSSPPQRRSDKARAATGERRSRSHSDSPDRGDRHSGSIEKDLKKQSKQKTKKVEKMDKTKERLPGGPFSPTPGSITSPPVFLPPRQTAATGDAEKPPGFPPQAQVEDTSSDLPIRLNIRRAIRTDHGNADSDSPIAVRTPSIRTVAQSVPRIAVKRATGTGRQAQTGRNTPPGGVKGERDLGTRSPPNVSNSASANASSAPQSSVMHTSSSNQVVAPLSRVDELDSIDTPVILRHAATESDLARVPFAAYYEEMKKPDEHRHSYAADDAALHFEAANSANKDRSSRFVISPNTLTLAEASGSEIVSPVCWNDELSVAPISLELAAPVRRNGSNENQLELTNQDKPNA